MKEKKRSENPEEDYVVSGKDFNIEEWYEETYKIHVGLTAFTKFIDFSFEEMQLIVDLYRLGWISSFTDKNETEEMKREKEMKEKEEDKNLSHEILKLKEKIELVMVSMKNDDDGFFVRLSCRSPKDGVGVLLNKTSKEFEEKCKEKYNQRSLIQPPNSVANQFMIDYFRFISTDLRVTDTFELFHLITSSERVYRDLLLMIEHKIPCKMAIRNWDKDIHDIFEFRCFIHNGVLTAISQYNHYIYIPIVNKFENQFRDAIMKFHKSISDKIGIFYTSYVMDVAVKFPDRQSFDSLRSEDIEKNALTNIVIIEFNPFDTYTGPSLYDWTIDSKLLHEIGNDGQVCIRTHKKPIENCDQWADMLKETMDVMVLSPKTFTPKIARWDSLLRRTLLPPPSKTNSCTLI